MAVSLPSDLIADVMRNAEPARRSAAAARLQSMGSRGIDFADVVGQARQPAEVKPGVERSTHLAAGDTSAGAAGRGRATNPTFARFEQMVLRNLFETLLPAQESGAFGGGPSAGIWRSMAADQLAGTLAENGGIGISRMLASSTPDSAPLRDAQWPYFSLHPLRAPGSEG
jgi:flagellar protein FlgJ